ncbi:galactose-1-phosphate uridylyltransferase [Schlesneria paludicola]|uniref:galactose-1-phosphate uridylyltransferase n=1 Tax=Schlesneria paludicola TaxID=360056 RepID=UPI0004929A52|nr:galactose-1-phosphate uridylyltransferase [Schlesneria paludicola]
MPEFRKDPLFDRWVVIAPERANRPFEILDATVSQSTFDDPFAEGNESATPSEVLAYRNAGSTANGPGWRVRIVPNQFPAVDRNGGLGTHSDGLNLTVEAWGVHDVIVECPHCESNLSHLSVENVREVFLAYRDRMLDLKGDPRIAHISIFKNQGQSAGASVRHSHSQLIATPIVPPLIQEELSRALDHYEKTSQSIYQKIIEDELRIGARVVLATDHFVAICPFASRFSFETWIIPQRSNSHYFQLTPIEVDDLGTVVKTILCKLELACDNPPYNLAIHTAPVRAEDHPSFSWHLEILPRISGIAGFEWGAGIHINSMPPEQAAATLRSTACDHMIEK